MKILSRNQQDEIICLLQDILVKTAYVSQNNSTVFDIVYDSCFKIRSFCNEGNAYKDKAQKRFSRYGKKNREMIVRIIRSVLYLIACSSGLIVKAIYQMRNRQHEKEKLK